MIAAPVIAAVTYKYRRKPLGRASSGVAGVRFFISRNKDTQNGSLNATIEIHICGGRRIFDQRHPKSMVITSGQIAVVAANPKAWKSPQPRLRYSLPS